MSGLPSASRAADELLPPMDIGPSAGIVLAVTTVAQNFNLATLFGANAANILARGMVYITTQSRGGISYVRFKSTATAAATTAGNASNGLAIADGAASGVCSYFIISPAMPILDVIGSAALSLFIYPSSPNYSNRPVR